MPTKNVWTILTTSWLWVLDHLKVCIYNPCPILRDTFSRREMTAVLACPLKMCTILYHSLAVGP